MKKRFAVLTFASVAFVISLGCGASTPSKPPDDPTGNVKKNIGDTKESGKKQEYKFAD